MQSHTMELPRLIEIGEKNIEEFGKFLYSLNKPKKVSLISGTNVQNVLKNADCKLHVFRVLYTFQKVKMLNVNTFIVHVFLIYH